MTSIRRILVPVDLSKSSRAALDYAVQFSAPLKASLEVLFVWDPNGYAGAGALALAPPPRARSWDDARLEMRREVEQFLGPHREAVREVRIESGVAADVIPETAREGEFDLIVMGSHGRSNVARPVGSVAEAVMRKSHVPVLTLRLPVRVPKESIPL